MSFGYFIYTYSPVVLVNDFCVLNFFNFCINRFINRIIFRV